MYIQEFGRSLSDGVHQIYHSGASPFTVVYVTGDDTNASMQTLNLL